MVGRKTWIRVVSLAVAVAFFGVFVVPEAFADDIMNRYETGTYGTNFETKSEYGTGSEGMGRALGGAAGMAGGAIAGTALASTIVTAAGGALVGLPGAIVTACVICGLGLVGGKLGSRMGAWADRKMGPQMTWTLFGASIGAFAGLMFLGAVIGPWAGAMAPILKVLIGGVVGGVLGRLFAPQLQAHATPKLLYAGLGGFIGGLGFGIPGALAGVAAGYVLGGLFDRNMFSDPRRGVANDLGIDGVINGVKDLAGWIKNRTLDVKNWVGNNVQEFDSRVQAQWNNDPYYRYSSQYYPSDYAYAGYNQGSYSSFNPGSDKYGHPEYQTQYNTTPYYSGNYSANQYDTRQNYYDSYNTFTNQMQSGNRADQTRAFEQMMQNNQNYRSGFYGY